MIDNQLIESARTIRKDFLALTSELNFYRDDIKKLADFLFEKVKYLEDYQDKHLKKLKNNSELNEVTQHIIKEIDSIEIAEKKLQSKIKVVNEKMERLKKDEEVLYKTIKTRYPELTDQEIRKQIHSQL